MIRDCYAFVIEYLFEAQLSQWQYAKMSGDKSKSTGEDNAPSFLIKTYVYAAVLFKMSST